MRKIIRRLTLVLLFGVNLNSAFAATKDQSVWTPEELRNIAELGGDPKLCSRVEADPLPAQLAKADGKAILCIVCGDASTNLKRCIEK